GPPAHAAPCLRLHAGRRRQGHAVAASLSGPQEHPAHRPLHRAGTDPIQGLVEGLSGGLKGVDAAELGTARGESARRAMVALVAGRLTCELTGEQTHGREVGYCFTSGGLAIKPACNGKRDPRPRLGQRVANVIWKGSMLAYAYGNAAPTQLKLESRP